MKRALDISVSLIALAILAVPMALIAIAVWLQDRSSPFYRGPRIGMGQRPFAMLKFRSMHPGASKTGVNSTASSDPRITRTGRVLRRFKLDELPQLWNVLTGDMSLVGPRPQAPADAALYTLEERKLFDVRPGVTDLASIVFSDEAEILRGSADPDLLYNQIVRPWKSRLALAYLEHAGLWLDLDIVLLTALSFFSRRGALDAIARLLEYWDAEPLLIRAARRESPPLAYSPPGAREIVSCYPQPAYPHQAASGSEIRMEDLLGRRPIEFTAEPSRLRGATVLVTGAGGSIGSELCRQIAFQSPAALIGFDHSENALYELDREIRALHPRLAFYPELGSVRNSRRLEELFERHGPEAVYHAAAYKHVPMMESQLFEAVENNVFGTRNAARAAAAFGAREFVLISSDKAVRPASVMGATKRLAEMTLQSLAAPSMAGPANRTRFLAVRFGNVLGSSGSVVPAFREQIARGGPVRVTHPDMQRFFMTISEAASLVLQAAGLPCGEIFALDMGPPVRILDLARRMIRLSGLEPGRDIAIEFTGIRPGEKLYEELSACEESTLPTPHRHIRVFSPAPTPARLRARALDRLETACEERDAEAVVRVMEDLAPGYRPSTHLLRRATEEKARAAFAYSAVNE